MTKGKKFNVLGHEEIDIDRLHPNPKNPRPTFHFGEDNPEIIALGDSISSDGLHNPLKVYELMPEAPSEYMIVQGHRRYAGATLAGVKSLDCIIVSRPADEKEELEWLGSEDAHKRAWSESGLFQMRHAYELAKRLNLKTCAHPDVVARTGLSMTQLQTAEKVFKLEREIQALCVAYERVKYEQLLSGDRKKGQRLVGSGVKVNEFPPERAAQVWDLFEALREKTTMLVKEWDDLDLQLKISQWVTQRGGVEALKNLTAAVRVCGSTPRPGLMTQIADLLNNENRKVADIVRTTRNTHIVKLARANKNLQTLDQHLTNLLNNMDQIGGDIDLMKEVDRNLLAVVRHADEFQRKLEKKIKTETKGF